MWSFTCDFLKKSGPLPKKWGPLHMIFWKKGTLTWINGPFTHDFLKNEDLYVWFSEKSVPRKWKMCTFTHGFLKKGTSTWKMWTFTRHFLKKMDLYQKNVDLYAWFSEKSGPRPVNVDLLRMIFWNMWTFMHVRFSKKKWTSTWKMWTFMLDFLEKSRPQPGKCGLLRVIFWRKWPSTLDFYAWFSEKCRPRPEKFGPLCVIFWKT